MSKLSDKQIAEYFQRCYTAVDGLWFMKVEEKFGFDTALDIDNEVWKVLPKIQARKLKAALKTEQIGIKALHDCLSARLDIESFEFETEQTEDEKSLTITIKNCPWHNLLLKSGRENLSEKIGSKICNTEYSVWAAEFGENIKFELKNQICKGDNCCVLHFSKD